MGWFDEQIRLRKKLDDDVLADTYVQIAGAVLGKKIRHALDGDRIITKNAIDEILKYLHFKSCEIPLEIVDADEQLEYAFRPHGIMRRTVKLTKGWYKDAMGAMMGVRKSDGRIVAFIPSGISGYTFKDPQTNKLTKVNAKNETLFEEEAIAVYNPLPTKSIGISALLKYIIGVLSLSDFVMLGAATLVVTLLGTLMPRVNNILFSNVINSGDYGILAAISVFLVSITLSVFLITGVKNMITYKINSKVTVFVRAATMMRMLSLPAKFFTKFSSGELFVRMQYTNALCQTLTDTVLTTGLTSLFSIVYVTQIFAYAPALTLPAVLITMTTLAFSIISTLVQMRISEKQMESMSKEGGITYAFISGIQKIKLTGAEKRAFAKWGTFYAKGSELKYNPPLFLKVNPAISVAITLLGTIVIYYQAIQAQVSVADYFAFTSAYGMFSGAFVALSGIALSVAQIRPTLKMVKPMLEAVPEISEGKQVLTGLGGSVEINNVSFRYADNMPLVIDDLSLKIHQGQYVAIVGKTGCGKSTLLRLLLGFEKPASGAIYYDGRDVEGIDLKSLRRHIGTVMQNGKLFMGDVYSNIVISAPDLSLEEAWEAAELSGIAEDIRRMPMGMYTMIAEGSGGISGGQKQRLMIARAIAPKPKILMFDEATSALDNITQKKVAESLDGLKCTRIVIAHRLSTIKHCDRIIVLDGGKIIEDGKYDELIEKNGHFAELVARQRLDAEQ